MFFFFATFLAVSFATAFRPAGNFVFLADFFVDFLAAFGADFFEAFLLAFLAAVFFGGILAGACFYPSVPLLFGDRFS